MPSRSATDGGIQRGNAGSGGSFLVESEKCVGKVRKVPGANDVGSFDCRRGFSFDLAKTLYVQPGGLVFDETLLDVVICTYMMATGLAVVCWPVNVSFS